MADVDDPTGLGWEVLLPRVGDAVARCHRALLAEHGLSPTALVLLTELDRRGGLSHRELAARLGRTPATLTPVVDALERAGDVGRARDARDRRVVRLSLTDEGRERLRRATAAVAARLPSRLPAPRPEHVGPVRDYLVSVLVALRDPVDP
ncbi:MarR family winged helix-turn-helix transcriptional regulator [Pseudonocardia lacus]|uniref:MarR family winged helix-turn-helix transcriptional regulator n=1 Tax=Pseudonocardia lacus TaxID=2835865 RepID=UPI001BDC3279|nr:MarR family transcriptional regulator [Pseudonocardia lacus]